MIGLNGKPFTAQWGGRLPGAEIDAAPARGGRSRCDAPAVSERIGRTPQAGASHQSRVGARSSGGPIRAPFMRSGRCGLIATFGNSGASMMARGQTP